MHNVAFQIRWRPVPAPLFEPVLMSLSATAQGAAMWSNPPKNCPQPEARTSLVLGSCTTVSEDSVQSFLKGSRPEVLPTPHSSMPGPLPSLSQSTQASPPVPADGVVLMGLPPSWKALRFLTLTSLPPAAVNPPGKVKVAASGPRLGPGQVRVPPTRSTRVAYAEFCGVFPRFPP